MAVTEIDQTITLVRTISDRTGQLLLARRIPFDNAPPSVLNPETRNTSERIPVHQGPRNESLGSVRDLSRTSVDWFICLEGGHITYFFGSDTALEEAWDLFESRNFGRDF